MHQRLVVLEGGGLTVVDTGTTVAEGGLALGDGIKNVGGSKMRWEDLMDPNHYYGPPGDPIDQALNTPAQDFWKKYPGGRR